MQAILAGSPLAGRQNLKFISNELGEVTQSASIFRQGRRQLLQIVHSTRALDTALKELLTSHGIPTGNQNSLGAYLLAFENHSIGGVSKLPKANRQRYQISIVNARNKYMHQAGSFPSNDGEVRSLLSEMQACLIEVFSL